MRRPFDFSSLPAKVDATFFIELPFMLVWFFILAAGLYLALPFLTIHRWIKDY